jgi:hypothetical protein
VLAGREKKQVEKQEKKEVIKAKQETDKPKKSRGRKI